MFTGIIEDTGNLESISKDRIIIRAKITDVKVGDSIAINGICLTVKEIVNQKSYSLYSFDISAETYNRTNLKFLKKNDLLNLERALKLDSRLDGHIVTGHIDDIAKILSKRKIQNSYEIEISIPQHLNKFIAEKGSIAVDGISLTIAKKYPERFRVAIIPYTYENTNLKTRKVGDYVNLEVDIIARYVESILLERKDSSVLKKITGV